MRKLMKDIFIFILLLATSFLFFSSTLKVTASDGPTFEDTSKINADKAFIYYNLLSDDQKIVYNQVFQELTNFNEELFKLQVLISHDDFFTVMNAVYNDHPEIFWADTRYSYGVNANNEVVKVKLKYCIDKKDFEVSKQAYDTLVNNLTLNIKALSNDLEKEKAIYQIVCNMTTYDATAPANQSAYSVLFTGKSVCAGYARAFQVLCRASGLNCYYIFGSTTTSNVQEEHAWNIVEIDGVYYNVDVTADDGITDTSGLQSFKYLNMPEKDFCINHTRSQFSALLPISN